MGNRAGTHYGSEGRFRPPEPPKSRRHGRLLAVFKALVLLALMAGTAYGMLNSGLFGDERLLPFAAGTLLLFFITILVRDFYGDVPTAGWVMVAFMAVLVGIKGLSMTWTLSETETIKEVIRSSMYLAAFVMALAALSSERQIVPLVDIAVLTVAGVAGYGLLQKISPIEYPVTSLDGVRVDSTLGYANTAAMLVVMGLVLALARISRMRSAVFRGVYAVLVLAFLVTLYLTVSRGGIGALGIGLVVFLILGNERLQTLANLLLVCVPGAWLWWRMRELDGLLTKGVSDEQRIADGTAFGNDLTVALLAAFVLQVGYSLLIKRYELMPLGRKVLGSTAVAAGALVLLAGGAVLVNQYGGIGQTYQALLNNPNQTENTVQRLASLSVGFREDYWRVAWNEWMEHPLTGSGAGTFTYTWFRERPVTTGVKQVHNVYLEQGTETGLFAFLALTGFAVFLVGYTGRAAWKAREHRDRRALLAGLTAAVTVYLVSSIFEWHWYIPPSTLFFFILAAIAVKVASRKDWAVSEDRAESAGGT